MAKNQSTNLSFLLKDFLSISLILAQFQIQQATESILLSVKLSILISLNSYWLFFFTQVQTLLSKLDFSLLRLNSFILRCSLYSLNDDYYPPSINCCSFNAGCFYISPTYPRVFFFCFCSQKRSYRLFEFVIGAVLRYCLIQEKYISLNDFSEGVFLCDYQPASFCSFKSLNFNGFLSLIFLMKSLPWRTLDLQSLTMFLCSRISSFAFFYYKD